MSRRRVAILAGGRSSEHDVSVDSARSVSAALNSLGAEVTTIAIGRSGRWELEQSSLEPAKGQELDRVGLPAGNVAKALQGVDVIFPLLHGPFGEDGTVQGLLELADVPYVGAGVAASAIAMDKDLFKAVLRSHGIPTPASLTIHAGQEVRNPFRYPVFVKPARLGSSIGISKAHNAAELEGAAADAFGHDDKILVEEFVEGVEIEVGVLGNREPLISLPGEIVLNGNEWYDYEAKYDEGRMDLVVPARISAAQSERARRLALESFTAIGCEGMARVDMFVSTAGEVLVNELNTIPGFTSTSVYAKLFAASGVEYGPLLETLIELALDRHERRRQLSY